MGLWNFSAVIIIVSSMHVQPTPDTAPPPPRRDLKALSEPLCRVNRERASSLHNCNRAAGFKIHSIVTTTPQPIDHRPSIDQSSESTDRPSIDRPTNLPTIDRPTNRPTIDRPTNQPTHRPNFDRPTNGILTDLRILTDHRSWQTAF